MLGEDLYCELCNLWLLTVAAHKRNWACVPAVHRQDWSEARSVLWPESAGADSVICSPEMVLAWQSRWRPSLGLNGGAGVPF